MNGPVLSPGRHASMPSLFLTTNVRIKQSLYSHFLLLMPTLLVLDTQSCLHHPQHRAHFHVYWAHQGEVYDLLLIKQGGEENSQ